MKPTQTISQLGKIEQAILLHTLISRQGDYTYACDYAEPTESDKEAILIANWESWSEDDKRFLAGVYDLLPDSEWLVIDDLAYRKDGLEKRMELKVYHLLRELKNCITNECRANDETHLPSLLVTISTDNNGVQLAHQTGDNSFSGACYFHRHWAVIELYRRSNCKELARQVTEELQDQLAQSND